MVGCVLNQLKPSGISFLNEGLGFWPRPFSQQIHHGVLTGR